MNVSKPFICNVNEIMNEMNFRNSILSEWGDVCEIMGLLSFSVFWIFDVVCCSRNSASVIFVKLPCLYFWEDTKLRIV
jgi:hypothetical protein